MSASTQLGLPASLTTTTDLPFPILNAVRFEDQAAFHPRKYCLGMAAMIPGNGSHLFELTRAIDVDDADPCVVTTERGTVRAGQVVIATELPIIDKGGYFAKTSPSRSYGLAARIDGPVPQGLYLGVGQGGRSVRPYRSGEQDYLIVVGEDHPVGDDPDTRRRYTALEAWARERFPVRAVDYRWSAQDYMPADHIPYIGRMTTDTERLYTATGFKKWGLSTGTFAAMIISDAILGRDNPWASFFEATRLDLSHSAGTLIGANVEVAKHYVGDKLSTISPPPIDELAPGEGGIVDLAGETVAASRDDAGTLAALSPDCTHLGCRVSWNTAEWSWDCPCHGSRFDRDGHVIHAPAVHDLEPKAANQV